MSFYGSFIARLLYTKVSVAVNECVNDLYFGCLPAYSGVLHSGGIEGLIKDKFRFSFVSNLYA